MPYFYRQKFSLIILLLFIFFNSTAQSPKRICVLGSSSAFGYFGNPPLYPRDSSWTFKLKKYYKDAGIIDTLYNLAVSGIDPYSAMPTNYVPPPNRELPDPARNISKAVSLVPKPDIIIVNFPSNHYDYQTPSEIIYCLQTIKDYANANNIQCFITTTQPRDGFSPSERQKLKDLKVLIESTFGFWSIDFFSDIVVDSNLKIRPLYALGDNVHLNPDGHNVLLNKVIQKNIFFSAVAATFGNITSQKLANKIMVNWQVFQEINNEKFIVEKSYNGFDFIYCATVFSRGNSITAQSYSFIDPKNEIVNVYYRVAAVNASGAYQYSAVTLVKAGPGKANNGFIFPTIATDKISLLIGSSNSESVNIQISDMLGRKLIAKNAVIQNNELFLIPVSELKAGSYILSTKFNNRIQSYPFLKL